MKQYTITFLSSLLLLFIASKFLATTPQGAQQRAQKQERPSASSQVKNAPESIDEVDSTKQPETENTTLAKADSSNPSFSESDKTTVEHSKTPEMNELEGSAKLVRDARGQPQAIEADKIKFDWDAAKIKTESYPTLEKVADLIKRTDRIAVLKIEGHTDASGDPLYNQYLSEQRAKAVAEFLKSKGVDETILAFSGAGDSKPIDNNETVQGRAKNRRVEFKITAE